MVMAIMEIMAVTKKTIYYTCYEKSINSHSLIKRKMVFLYFPYIFNTTNVTLLIAVVFKIIIPHFCQNVMVNTVN